MLKYQYEIYVTKRKYNINIDDYTKFSKYRIKKIEDTKLMATKSLNYQTEELLYYALKLNIKDLTTYPELLTTKQGKPYLENIKYKFNISHSKEFIAVGIGKNDLGIDIEVIDEKRLRVAKKLFNKDELNKFNNNIDYLIKTWTIKEAYVKLFDLSVLIDLRNIIIKDDKVFSSYGSAYFNVRKIDNYYLSIVTKNKAKVRVINI